MMALPEWVLPLVVGGAALAYVTMPFWSRAAVSLPGSGPDALALAPRGPGAELVDLERELGKIDDDEWRGARERALERERRYEVLEAQARARAAAPATSSAASDADHQLEVLIAQARRERRFDLDLETEILIARARRSARDAAPHSDQRSN